MRKSEPEGFGNITAYIIIGFLIFVGVSWFENAFTKSFGEISASLDRNSAKVGSIVELTLNYRLPEGDHLPEEPQIKGLKGFTVLEHTTEHGQIRFKILIDSLDSWKSEPLGLTYVDKQGKKQTLMTDPISLTVLSNLEKGPEEAQLRPIQGIEPVRTVWLKYFSWGAGLLGLLLIVIGAIMWQKRREAKRRFQEIEDPPHIRARKELEQLEAWEFFEKGYVKEFYFSFSEILRRYIESLRHFPAAEFTTEEIVRHTSNEQDRKILPLLQQADLVKFADKIPTHAGKEEDVKIALSYIQETSLTPENSG